MLSIRQLAKTYAGPQQRTVLTGIDLELVPGDYVAVMGESGIGKSTLLNLVAGLDRPGLPRRRQAAQHHLHPCR